jgi:hypothetical protein
MVQFLLRGPRRVAGGFCMGALQGTPSPPAQGVFGGKLFHFSYLREGLRGKFLCSKNLQLNSS